MRTVIPLVLAAFLLTGCGQNAHQAQTTPPTGSSPAPVQPDSPPYPVGSPQATAPAPENGMAPVVRRIPTDKRYVFLTIDDGEIKDPAAVHLAEQGLPTLFLNERYFKTDPAYFTSLNAPIEDHTANHPNLRGKPYPFQHQEICADADAEQRTFGTRPTLFRPPFGNYDDNTRKAAAACGLKALVLWDETINNGTMQFQAGHHLNPGDIVLMHFRKTFTEDYQAFLTQAKADGMTPARLPDFLS